MVNTQNEPGSENKPGSDRRREDRRRWDRYPASGSKLTILSDNSRYEAFALDESVGGIGVTTDEAVALVNGQSVELIYEGAKLKGQVAGVYPNEEGGCRLSISWDCDRSDLPSNKGCKPFFRFRGMTIACDILGEEPKIGCDPKQAFQIRMSDGSIFDVTARQIVFRTRKSRCTEIVTMGPARHVLLQLYAIDSNPKHAVEIESILDFEFANQTMACV